MEKTVSVIVPIYNSARYLEKCLDSIISQTYRALEIICVDDGSSDGSYDILSSYAERDCRIIPVRKENEGASFARNLALDMASGEYVMFVDSDDYIDPETVERAVASSIEHDADVVMWSYVREAYGVSRKKVIAEDVIVYDEGDVRDKLHRRMIGPLSEETAAPENMDALCPACVKLYRRSVIEENGIRFFDIRRIGTYEDGLFNLDVFGAARRAVFIPEYFYHYRRDNEDSLTIAYKAGLADKWDVMYDVMRRRIEEERLGDEYREALRCRIALSLVGLGLNEMEARLSLLEKARNMKAIMDKPHYREAVAALRIAPLPLHWKGFFICAKMRSALCVTLLLRVMQRLRGR